MSRDVTAHDEAYQTARRLRDKAASPALRDYWQQVMEGIVRRRAEEKTT